MNEKRDMGVPIVYRGHTSWVRAVAWAPDGRFIASTGKDQTVQIWEALSAKPIVTYRGHQADLYAVAWSPDGRYIVSGGMDETVQIWEALTATCVWTYEAEAWIEDAMFSPDGRYVAVACLAGVNSGVHIWRFPDMLPITILRGPGEMTQSLSWSTDGHYLAYGDDEGNVTIWNTVTGCQFTTMRDSDEAIFALAWAPDNKRVAFGGTSATIHVRNIDTGQVALIYRGHEATVYRITWSPDSRCVASASGNIVAATVSNYDVARAPNEDVVHVWEAVTGRLLSSFHGHSSVVQGLSWSPSGHYIASASFDCTVQVWKV